MANAPYFIGEPGTLAPRGMFGGRPKPETGGRGLLSRLGDFVTAWGAARGNPLGQFALQSRAATEARLMESLARQQQRDQDREDRRDDWLFQQQWQRDNPAPRAPLEIERILQTAGIDPQSEQGQAMLRQYANNRVNPIQGVRVTNPDGSEGIQFIRPGQAGAPPSDADYWTPVDDEGGPSQPASGTFP